MSYQNRGDKSEDRKLFHKDEDAAIKKMNIDVMPDQLKLDDALWTTRAVRDLIARAFRITIGRRAVGDYLNALGFKPQKPKKRAYEQCFKKAQQCLEEEYPAIKEKAKQQKATIHWEDETGVKNNNHQECSYAPKGKTPVKKHMSKRFSINMISTVTNQGLVQFMIYKENMNSDVFIQFLEQLVKSQETKVFLILDNLRVHHSKVVKKWANENAESIELFFLPSYSPERNPDEYLNCDLKYSLSDKPAPKTQEKMK